MRIKTLKHIGAGSLLLLLMLTLPQPLPAAELDISEAESLALEASNEIRRAAEQIAISSFASELALRAYLPQLKVNYSRSRQTDYYAPDSDVFQFGAAISQPVFNGGRNLKTAALNNINSALSITALEEQKRQLKDQVFQLFYGILLNREKLSIQRELLELSNTRMEITERKHLLGAVTELDCIEASIEIQNIRLEILDTEYSMKIQVRDFSILTGHPLRFCEENPQELKGSVDRNYSGLKLQTADSSFYNAMAQKNNINIRRMEAELIKRRTELDISNSAFLPIVSLEAALNIRGTKLPLQEPGCSVSLQFDFPEFPAPLTFTNAAGIQDRNCLSLSTASEIDILPDFNFLVTKKQAALLLRQASEQLADARISLSRNISTSLTMLEHQRIKINIMRETQSLLKRKLIILETRSRMGEVRELDLLQARISFCGEEISILDYVLELMKAERDFAGLTGLSSAELQSVSETLHQQKETI